jgi:hypothetical protein
MLIIASIGAIVLYFARRRLVGRKGIALGLLMTSYGIDAPESLLSFKFWSALSFDTSKLDPAAIGLSLLLLFSAILCQLVGPASAGVIQPNLDWWHVSDPYNGQKLPVYLSARTNETYLMTLNKDTWPMVTLNPDDSSYLGDATVCLNQTSLATWCPGYGLEAVQTWTLSDFLDHTAPNLTIVDSTGTQRTLTADLVANGTAIATTQSNWVIHMYGLFVQFIKLHHLGLVDSITYPMYTSTDPIYAPVVQVQCHTVDANKTNVVEFFTDNLTNYTESGASQYNPQLSWPVPKNSWNFDSKDNDINFTWVDFSNGQDWHPSIGAVAKIPGWVEGQQEGFYTIPCIIDARWAASSATYQPTISEIIMSNLTSPAAFALGANSSRSISAKAKANPRQQLGIGDAIQIDAEWADILNIYGYSSSPSYTNFTSIQLMLNSYITEISGTPYRAFAVELAHDTFVNNTAQLMQAAANTTATILSLAIADGLSRLSDTASDMLVLNTTGDGNVTWTFINSGSFGNESSEASHMAQFTSLELQVQRYGWGYSWSIVIILDVVVLFIHVFMVVSYAGYQIFLRLRGRWWATTAWDDAVELLLLAWDSTPTEVFRESEEGKSSPWAQNISVRERDGGDGDAIELVAGRPNTTSGGGLLKVGKKYM